MTYTTSAMYIINIKQDTHNIPYQILLNILNIGTHLEHLIFSKKEQEEAKAIKYMSICCSINILTKQ